MVDAEGNFDDFQLSLSVKNSPSEDHDLWEKVNERLPISVKPDDVRERPYFQQLLVSLCDRLTPQGLPIHKHVRLQEAEVKVRQSRKAWLQQHVFYECMREMIHEWMLDKDKKSEYRSTVQDAFYASVGAASLHLPDNVTLLGLSRDDVIDNAVSPAKFGGFRNRFIVDLEEFVRKKCELVTKYHDTTDQGSRILSTRASMLPMVVEDESIKRDEEKKNFELERREVDKQLASYHKALERVRAVFEDLLTRLKLTVLSEKDRVDCDWLLARAEALMLKSRIIELQLMCDLYNKDTVPVLEALSKHLDEELEAREEELKQIELMLQAYEAVGPEYDLLVAEYAKLRQVLDDKLWAKQELAANLRTT